MLDKGTVRNSFGARPKMRISGGMTLIAATLVFHPRKNIASASNAPMRPSIMCALRFRLAIKKGCTTDNRIHAVMAMHHARSEGCGWVESADVPGRLHRQSKSGGNRR